MSNAIHNISVTPKKRLLSLDVLRGFTMFWIIGARDIANGLAGLNIPGIAAVRAQLYHSKWNGFTFYDLIFPMFIFIIGVSLVLSLQKRLERGESRQALVLHVVKRSVILFVLGLVYNELITTWPHLENLRYMGVLQRLAICYFFVSILVLYTKPRTQAITAAVILVGYWAAMRFVPVPGYGPGVWSAQGSLVRYIDSLLLPGKLDYGNWDSEGLLSTVPAIATCILGVLSGYWLGTGKSRLSQAQDPQKRALYLFSAGIALALLALMFSPVFPINKKLWTSSYVLLTGGLSAMLLSAFYWVIDIRGYRKWSFPFMVIGMNSIFIYMGERFLPFGQLADRIMGSIFLAIPDSSQALLTAMTELLLEIFLLLLFYRRKIFIRI